MESTDKSFNVRIRKDLWVFLKKTSAKQERSMNKIIHDLVKSYKEQLKKNS